MNAKLQKELEGLSARVARLQKDFGFVENDDREEGGILQKREIRKSTAANDPPIESIDGQRNLIAELLAASVSRGNALTQSAMLRSKAYRAYLAEVTTNDPYLPLALLEAVLEADRTDPNNEPAGLDTPLGEDYDEEAYAAAQARKQQLQIAREMVSKPVADVFAYRAAKGKVPTILSAAKFIADFFAAGGKDASAADVAKYVADSKPAKEPMVDRGLRKADGTPVDVRDLGRPRKMRPEEVLR